MLGLTQSKAFYDSAVTNRSNLHARSWWTARWLGKKEPTQWSDMRSFEGHTDPSDMTPPLESRRQAPGTNPSLALLAQVYQSDRALDALSCAAAEVSAFGCSPVSVCPLGELKSCERIVLTPKPERRIYRLHAKTGTTYLYAAAQTATCSRISPPRLVLPLQVHRVSICIRVHV
jgi:hypothetical protein